VQFAECLRERSQFRNQDEERDQAHKPMGNYNLKAIVLPALLTQDAKEKRQKQLETSAS